MKLLLEIVLLFSGSKVVPVKLHSGAISSELAHTLELVLVLSLSNKMHTAGTEIITSSLLINHWELDFLNMIMKEINQPVSHKLLANFI